MDFGRMLVRFIYVQPLYRIIIIAVLAIILWAKIMSRLESQTNKRTNKRRICVSINVLLLGIWIFGVLCATLVEREKQETEIVLCPLYSLSATAFSTETIRMLVMNAFLFLPFGICFPFIFSCDKKKRILRTILVAILISGSIEIAQLLFHIGCCEVDDVIMNTSGAFIGTFAYRLGSENCEESYRKAKKYSD